MHVRETHQNVYTAQPNTDRVNIFFKNSYDHTVCPPISALGVSAIMRYINRRFTYLLTYYLSGCDYSSDVACFVAALELKKGKVCHTPTGV